MQVPADVHIMNLEENFLPNHITLNHIGGKPEGRLRLPLIKSEVMVPRSCGIWNSEYRQQLNKLQQRKFMHKVTVYGARNSMLLTNSWIRGYLSELLDSNDYNKSWRTFRHCSLKTTHRPNNQAAQHDLSATKRNLLCEDWFWKLS